MSPQRWSLKSRRRISWLGLIALSGGMLLVYLFFDRPQLSRSLNPITPLIYLGTGVVLMIWGLRELISELFSAFSRLKIGRGPRFHVRMPREAQVYVLILFVLFLGALLGRSNMLLLVFGLMAGPFVLNGGVTLSMLKKTTVRRVLPPFAVAGQNFSVGLKLSNRKRWLSSWMLIVEDGLRNAREQLGPAVLFTRVPPKSESAGAYDVNPAHRGIYEFGPLQVMSRFPLGLMERSVEFGGIEELIVYPRIGRLTSLWRSQFESGSALVERHQGQFGIGGDEFHRLREYRSGDNRRAIHWRTTARRSELMIREYQPHQDRRLLLLLDLWQPSHPADTDLERVEGAISFAASVCADQTRQGTAADVRLIICGESVDTATGHGDERSTDALLCRLALAQAGSAPPTVSVLKELSDEIAGECRKLLITTRPGGEPTVRGLLDDAPRQNSDAAISDWTIIEATPDVVDEWVCFED